MLGALVSIDTGNGHGCVVTVRLLAQAAQALTHDGALP